MTTIDLPYTPERHLSFDVPPGIEARVLEPHTPKISASARTLVERALDNPLYSDRLESLVSAQDRVLIICDDNTRPLPAHLVLLPVVERLNRAGVSDRNIEVLFANGTHRPMSPAEMREKVGAEVFGRLACYNHDAFDRSQLRHYHQSEEGVDVWLNSRIGDASLVMAVGNIAPHAIVGYGGGAKMLYPGVAGKDTIAGFHVTFSLDSRNYYGAFPTPARTSIRHLADVAGLGFTVNTVLTDALEVVEVFAGEHEVVLRAGVDVARRIYGIPISRLHDVVVVSSYPGWIDFWQGCRGAFAGATLAKPGGDIVVVTACPEGSSHTYPNHPDYIGMPTDVLAGRLRSGDLPDPICAAGAIKVGYVREQYKVSIVSDGLSSGEVQRMGFERYPTVETALEHVVTRRSGVKEIAVMPYGGAFCYHTD